MGAPAGAEAPDRYSADTRLQGGADIIRYVSRGRAAARIEYKKSVCISYKMGYERAPYGTLYGAVGVQGGLEIRDGEVR